MKIRINRCSSCGLPFEEHLKLVTRSWVCDKFEKYDRSKEYPGLMKMVWEQHCSPDQDRRVRPWMRWFYTFKFTLCWYLSFRFESFEKPSDYRCNNVIVAYSPFRPGYSMDCSNYGTWDEFSVPTSMFKWYCSISSDSSC